MWGFINQLIAELSMQDSFDSNKCRIIHDSLRIQTVIIQYVLTQFCGVLTVEEQLSCSISHRYYI